MHTHFASDCISKICVDPNDNRHRKVLSLCWREILNQGEEGTAPVRAGQGHCLSRQELQEMRSEDENTEVTQAWDCSKQKLPYQ